MQINLQDLASLFEKGLFNLFIFLKPAWEAFTLFPLLQREGKKRAFEPIKEPAIPKRPSLRESIDGEESTESAMESGSQDLPAENLEAPAENIDRENDKEAPQSTQFITTANSVSTTPPIIIAVQTSDGAIRNVNGDGKIEINLANISVII